MENHKLRFQGLARIYGEDGLLRLNQAHILIIGLGGVGSWAVEALARSGVGQLSLMDFDEICVSNTNRQIHTEAATIGKSKVSVMASRVRAINPNIQVNEFHDFFTEKNASNVLSSHRYDFILDAIDSLQYKILLFNCCREKQMPLLITGAAGGKRNPSKIVIEDLGLSHNDNLLFRMRKKLRREDHSHRKSKKFGIDCIYSSEKALYPEECSTESLKLDCEQGLGSVVFLTGAFGLAAAYYIVEKICQK